MFDSKDALLGSIDQDRLICPAAAAASVAKPWAARPGGAPVLYGVAATNDAVAAGCGEGGCAWEGPEVGAAHEWWGGVGDWVRPERGAHARSAG
jgi:hypothetical protein